MIIIGSVSLGLLVPITGFSQGEPDSVKQGESIYQEVCSVCHGDAGNGQTWVSKTLNPPPRNFKDPQVIKTLNREQMFHSISNGRPGTGMQPFKSRLSDQEIESVIDFIRSTFMKIDIRTEKKKD